MTTFQQRKEELEKRIAFHKREGDTLDVERLEYELKGLQEGYDLARAEDLKIIVKETKCVCQDCKDGKRECCDCDLRRRLKAEISKEEKKQ